MVFRDGGFWEVRVRFRWGHEGGLPSHHGIGVLIKREEWPEFSLPTTVWGQTEKALSANQEEGSHQEPYLPAPWSWTRKPPELRNQCLLFTPASLWCWTPPLPPVYPFLCFGTASPSPHIKTSSQIKIPPISQASQLIWSTLRFGNHRGGDEVYGLWTKQVIKISKCGLWHGQAYPLSPPSLMCELGILVILVLQGPGAIYQSCQCQTSHMRLRHRVRTQEVSVSFLPCLWCHECEGHFTVSGTFSSGQKAF